MGDALRHVSSENIKAEDLAPPAAAAGVAVVSKDSGLKEEDRIDRWPSPEAVDILNSS